MELSFGARLRAQREHQQVTLAAIAEQSKIRQPLLEALERDDVSQWPGGIFGRSYLRSYAQAIGLDPEATVREFQELHPDPHDDASPVAAAAAAANGQELGRRPRTRLHFLIESVVGGRPQPPVLTEPKASPAHSSVAVHDAPIVSAALHPDGDTPPPRVDLTAMAELCTQLAQAQAPRDVEVALGEISKVLHAVGVILWLWDSNTAVLRPALAHGYARDMLLKMPVVRFDADNAIAAAFRSGATRVVEGVGSSTGAVVAPLITPTGYAGVLALELRGSERPEPVRALATILAAQLSLLVETPPLLRSATA